MNKDLVEVIQERNNFAHRFLVEDESDLSKIVLLRLKNKTERLEYSIERIKEISETIKRL